LHPRAIGTSPSGHRALLPGALPCQAITSDLVAPAMIPIGDQDHWSLPDGCRRPAAHNTDIGITRKPGTGAPMDLLVYPNATHAFDSNHQPHRYLGHVMRYDEDATRDANLRVRAFLREKPGDEAERQ
jgi:dienelactone hydrolase